jgi:hypothetical protein
MQQNGTYDKPNFTEGDEINIGGGSFDNREKFGENKIRNNAAQIPKSKINFKYGGPQKPG